MLIDCDSCQVRGAACRDCMVTVLLGPPVGLDLDEVEQAAVSALAAGGLIPPLRLVPVVTHREVDGAEGKREVG